MEIKNILSELEVWVKNELKGIETDESKLALRKQNFSVVNKTLQDVLKSDSGVNNVVE